MAERLLQEPVRVGRTFLILENRKRAAVVMFSPMRF